MSNVRAPENRWLASYAAALARFQALTFFLFASVSFASDDFQPVPPSQQPAAWQRFEAAHRGISNFVANVVQTKTMTVFQQPVVSEAKLWFARPNRFRWEVVKPAPSLTVSDGSFLSMYYPEFKQVERYPLKDPRLGSGPVKAITASLGENPATLTNSCDVAMFASTGAYRLDAVPRDPRDKRFLSRLVLDFDRTSLLLTKTTMETLNGDRTENQFVSIRANQEVDPALFHFEPPNGVKLVAPFSK